MSEYDRNLDYPMSRIDISEEESNEIIEELNEIIAKADSIISGNNTNSEKLAVAYLKKAQCLYKLANTKDFYDKDKLYNAKELLEKALELKADMPEAFMRLGTIYGDISKHEGGYFDEAINMLTKAIQLKPDYIAAFNNRSSIYWLEEYSRYKNEDYHDNRMKAIADLIKALQIRNDISGRSIDNLSLDNIVNLYKMTEEERRFFNLQQLARILPK
jgi:tetratricopeptide (TPR) repeat protein